MSDTLTLTGRHVRQVDVLEEPDDPPDGEARICRLAMLYHGESPANLNRCRQLLDLDLGDEYQDYIDPVLEQMTSGETPIPHRGRRLPGDDQRRRYRRPRPPVARPRSAQTVQRAGLARRRPRVDALHGQGGRCRPGRHEPGRLPGGAHRRRFFMPPDYREMEREELADVRVRLAIEGVCSWTESGEMSMSEIFEAVAAFNRVRRR